MRRGQESSPPPPRTASSLSTLRSLHIGHRARYQISLSNPKRSVFLRVTSPDAGTCPGQRTSTPPSPSPPAPGAVGDGGAPLHSSHRRGTKHALFIQPNRQRASVLFGRRGRVAKWCPAPPPPKRGGGDKFRDEVAGSGDQIFGRLSEDSVENMLKYIVLWS